MSSSNIIVKARYRTSNNRSKSIKKFCDYVADKEKADSMSLDESNVLDDYINYYDKDSFLFEKEEKYMWSQDGDISYKDELKKIKFDSNGLMWDLVISFDNDYALSRGLVTKKDFYELTKNIMPTFLTDLNLNLNNTTWNAGLHRNTSHPHIHLIFFENNVLNSFKVIPKGNIYKLKSYINNYLTDNISFYELRDKEFKNITNKISIQELAKVKSQRFYSNSYRRELNRLLLSFYNKIPKEGRLQYNSKNMSKYKKELDYIIEYILMHDPVKSNYQVYYNALEQHQKELNSTYGMSYENKNNKYMQDQLNRLYSKIGNEILNNFKIYQSKVIMEKEISFMKKNINELRFRSNSNYAKDETIISIGKGLYKICNMCDLNYNQTKKIFEKWINSSKYNYDINYMLGVCYSEKKEMSSTEYYKILKKLGYSFDRLKNIKEKNFYKEINYKVFINQAIKHIMFEYEQEQKEIEKEMEYDLEGL